MGWGKTTSVQSVFGDSQPVVVVQTEQTGCLKIFEKQKGWVLLSGGGWRRVDDVSSKRGQLMEP